ncbi:acyl-CoA carboxylase subunit epsilon, partial [Streptacidiphilus carbonis]|uniref:acyl-CoA carboxylase subunit epsilon n=1 Tax=Streptacidiphilus carbonis TaxID=105422 RepID=UPI00126A5F90
MSSTGSPPGGTTSHEPPATSPRRRRSLDAEESLLRIERGQVDHDELAALVVVLLTRRKVREKPAANGSRWSRRSGATPPPG